MAEQRVVNPKAPGSIPGSAATGMWRSLAAHLLWEQEAVGSSPTIPTTTAVTHWGEAQQVERLAPDKQPEPPPIVVVPLGSSSVG